MNTKGKLRFDKTSIKLIGLGDMAPATESSKKFPGSIANNYSKYLKESLRIGFTENFPISTIIDEMVIEGECRGFLVSFKVYYVRVSFKEGGKAVCDAVCTDRVSISGRLVGGGFGSHCYVDEAHTMELAVIEMCKKHDLMICVKVCSWPFAKAIVQNNFYIS